MEVYAFHLMPYPYGEDDVAWPISDDRFDPAKGPDLYERYLSEMIYCEELGYDAVGFNEHHYRAFGLMPSPNLVAANVAGRTDDIDIAIYGNILPLRGQPVRLAEELAMVDNMSDGRLISAFVRGLPIEHHAYGIDEDVSRDRFGEAWEIVERAWTEPDPFDFEGEHYQYEDVCIWPRPAQDPHPPLRMPAKSEESVQFAVDRRVPISRIFCPTEGMVDTFELYRELATDAGWSPTADHFEAGRIVYVAESMERAREEAEEHLRYFYNNLWGASYRAAGVRAVGDTEYREDNAFEYEREAPDKGNKAMNFDFEELRDAGDVIVGDPDYVTEQLEYEYEKVGGFGTLIGLFQFGTLPDHLVRKNLELFADEVMPELRRIG